MNIWKMAGNSILGIMLAGFLVLGAGEVETYVRAEMENENLRKQAEILPKETAGAEAFQESYGREPSYDFALLKTVNPHIRGWIRIPGTAVDYPVLIGEEEGEYLKKNFKGQEDPLGSVFSYTGTDLAGDACIFLFAHNLISGQMFGGLKKFLDQSYSQTHSRAYLCTPGGCRNYGFLSAETCRAEELPGMEAEGQEGILFLVTCSGGEGTLYRTVVRFIQQEPSEAAEDPEAG